MNLRIEEISYENIREFGDLTIDFTRDDSNEPHHISLVQMPNGTGKTTTMGLIRHLILGTDLDEDQVTDYEPEFGASEGEFRMSFATSTNRFRIHMELDYDIGSVTYRTAYPQREDGGINADHNLPFELDDVLTEELVDLFVFNGELTDEFTDTDEDKAESALKTVSRLDRVEAQRDRIDRIVEKQQTESAETEQGLKQLKTQLKKREQRLDDLRKKREEFNEEIEEHESNIEGWEEEREEIISENKEALKEFKRLEEEINTHKSNLETEAANLLADMRRPSKLSEEFKTDFGELLEHMTILKLPKSTSEEFFNELAEGDTCVCGRDLDDGHRESIRKNAEEYLSDEDIGVLNTLKEQLRSIAEVEDFESRFTDLNETRKKLKQKEMKQDGLDLDDPELEAKKQELTEKIESEKAARDRKKDRLDLLKTDDAGKRDTYDLDWKSNIPSAKRAVNEWEKKVEEATDTVTFGSKADRLDSIFERFIEQSLQELKEEQIRKTNERLSQILGLSEVQIGSIDDSIQLEGKSGASEGQTLSVAYAYLSTLFEGSQVDMPFVIDSPAVSLDHKVREEVASIVSGLFDQMIAFVISTEKEGFVENLEPRTHGGDVDIQYFTVHKTGTPGDVRKYTDKESFMEFTSENEEIESPAEME